ncbi:hypothetical protein [Nocardia sp. NPDC057353]|uniref:hypothetical protein n=1 Tax=Nocardia sp. NPDC057353 TaxID=3346104 RepID=UPI003626D761
MLGRRVIAGKSAMVSSIANVVDDCDTLEYALEDAALVSISAYETSPHTLMVAIEGEIEIHLLEVIVGEARSFFAARSRG